MKYLFIVLTVIGLSGCRTNQPLSFTEQDVKNSPKSMLITSEVNPSSNPPLTTSDFKAPAKPANGIVVETIVTDIHQHLAGSVSWDSLTYMTFTLKIENGRIPSQPAEETFKFTTYGIEQKYFLGDVLDFVFYPDGTIWGIDIKHRSK